MNVAPSVFAGYRSPEMSPEAKGWDRGTDSVTLCPERVSNPHPAKQEGILSPFSDPAEPVGIEPHRVKTGSGSDPKQAGLLPNKDRTSPDMSPDGLSHISDGLWERIRARVAFSPSGCWIWQGAKNSKGYACLRIGGREGRTVLVHRLVVALSGRTIGNADLACHTCDVPACVNPAHLYVGTASSNQQDMYARGRANNVLASRNASKTHCANGHPYSIENTIHRPAGDRLCRICRTVSNRRSHERRRQGAA